MSDVQFQRETEAVARSRSLRRNTMLVGTCVLLIVAGFVISTVTAYDMGYVDARSGSATAREIARFHLLGKSEVMGLFSGAGITFVGMVTLFRVLRELDE
jgi:hypothetical protein